LFRKFRLAAIHALLVLLFVGLVEVLARLRSDFDLTFPHLVIFCITKRLASQRWLNSVTHLGQR